MPVRLIGPAVLLVLPLAAQQAGPPLLRLHVSTAGLYESNLEHGDRAAPAVGGIVAAGFELEDRGPRTRFTASYEAALHRYTVRTPYARTSHRADAAIAIRAGRRLAFETGGSVRLRGGAEDRDLNNEYTVAEQLDLRLDQSMGLRLRGQLRVRRAGPSVSPDRNALARGVELALRHRLGTGGRLTLGARIEENAAAAARYDYTRLTWALDLESAPDGWQQVELGLRYRDQRYHARRVEDRGVRRRDGRVTPSLAWQVRPWSGFELRLAYEYERRWSNDPAEGYVAHQVGLTLTQSW